MNQRLVISLAVFLFSCGMSLGVVPFFEQRAIFPFDSWSLFDQDFTKETFFDILLEENGKPVSMIRNPSSAGKMHFLVFHESQRLGFRALDNSDFSSSEKRIRQWLMRTDARPLAIVRINKTLKDYLLLDDNLAAMGAETVYKF